MGKSKRTSQFALCVKNPGYSASLEVRKVYRRVLDSAAEKRGFVRIIDESGEDYLFPKGFFVRIDVPVPARRVFAGTA